MNIRRYKNKSNENNEKLNIYINAGIVVNVNKTEIITKALKTSFDTKEKFIPYVRKQLIEQNKAEEKISIEKLIRGKKLICNIYFNMIGFTLFASRGTIVEYDFIANKIKISKKDINRGKPANEKPDKNITLTLPQNYKIHYIQRENEFNDDMDCAELYILEGVRDAE